MNMTEGERKKVIIRLNDFDLDCKIEEVVKRDQAAFKFQANLVNHLVYSFIIKLRMGQPTNVNLARNVVSLINGTCLVEVPMINPQFLATKWRKDEVSVTQQKSSWLAWNEFHTATNFHAKVKIALNLNSMEIINLCEEEIKRWIGEPLNCIIVNSSSFVKVYQNWVLPKPFIKILKQFLPITTKIIIKCDSSKLKMKQFNEYIFELVKEWETERKNEIIQPDIVALPYQTVSSMDHYEVFGADSIKYRSYLRAIYMAINDKIKCKCNEPLVISILGAKSETLVFSTISAINQINAESEFIEIKINVYETNQIARSTMENNIKIFDKCSNVKLEFNSGISEYSEKTDIMLSDCLSFFGDNYLAPELLSNASHLLKKNGICIPANSTSFVCPAMSSKIFNKCKDFYRIKDYRDTCSFAGNNLESTFFVNPVNFYEIAKPEELFTFQYPAIEEFSHYKMVKFFSKIDATLHGFMGYFQAELYKNIILSTIPLKRTQVGAQCSCTLRPNLFVQEKIIFQTCPIHVAANFLPRVF